LENYPADILKGEYLKEKIIQGQIVTDKRALKGPAHMKKPYGKSVKVESRATQAETRYGCFLPDLTGLARRLSADLPRPYIVSLTPKSKR